MIYRDRIFMHIDNIGDMYLNDILLEYGYPRSFICKDQFGCYFVFYEMSCADRIDTWLVSKITPEEYQKVIDKCEAIQWAYRSRSAFNIFTVSKNHNDNTITYGRDIDKWINLLPEEPIYSEYDEYETLGNAYENKMPILDVKAYSGTNTHLVAANIFKNICNHLGDLIKPLSDNGTVLVPDRVLAAKGSCILRFGFSKANSKEYEEEYYSTINKIISAILDESIVPSILNINENNKDLFMKYKTLIKDLSDLDSSVILSVAMPLTDETLSVKFDRDFLKKKVEILSNALEHVRESSIQISDIITRWNKNRKSFSTVHEGVLYSGRISEGLIEYPVEMTKVYNMEISILKHYISETLIKEEYVLVALNS